MIPKIVERKTTKIKMSIEKGVDVAKVVVKAYEERADVGPLSNIIDKD